MPVTRRMLLRRALRSKGTSSPYSLFCAKFLKGTRGDIGKAATKAGAAWAKASDAQKKKFVTKARANGRARHTLKKKLSNTTGFNLFTKANFKKFAKEGDDFLTVTKRVVKAWKALSGPTKKKLAKQAQAHNKAAARALAKFE